MVDIPTAERHGICPECEGYLGRHDEDGYGIDCPNENCLGSCPQCWCPGCHDGNTGDPQSALAFGIDPEEYAGSWAAHVAVTAWFKARDARNGARL